LITLNDNAKMHGGYYTKIGEHGYGEVTLNDDAYFYNESKGGITLGVETTGRGKIVIEGGKVVGTSQYGVIGNYGNGELYVHKGEFNTRGITIGKHANSSGYVEVGRNGVLSTGTTDYNLYVGEEGKGVLNILGGTVYYSKRGTCQIRKNASGAGLLTGWGTVKYSAQAGELYNNGIIRADGGNENRVLVVQHTQPDVYNTIENDSTNGWYAINKGCLEIQGSAAYDVNDGVTVFNWGESKSDENIDLVNSVRFAVENITQKLTLGKARIYAPDHSDVPPLPSGRIAAGVWKFYFSGTYDSAQVQFRYDHTLAPKGVVIYQLSDDNSTWRKLDTSLLDGFRAQVSVSDASLMFAAVAQNPGLIITVR
jgi:T5SS/PEP-CTERM-associated repeat protein